MKKITMTKHEDLDAILYVARSMFDSTGPLDVTIKKHAKDLSAEQRGLYWMWVGIIGAEIGNTKDEQHLIFKERFLISIYARDPEGHPGFAEMATSIKALKNERPEEYKHIREQVIRLVSITDATIDNMTVYLNEIESEARNLRIQLPMPDFRGME